MSGDTESEYIEAIRKRCGEDLAYRMWLGSQLRAVREGRSLSQKMVSGDECNPRTVIRAEKGEVCPTTDTLQRVVTACRVTIDQVRQWAAHETPSPSPEFTMDATATAAKAVAAPTATRFTVLKQPSDVYAAICDAIEQTDREEQGVKRLYLAALHGLDVDDYPPEEPGEQKRRFDDLLQGRCIPSRGDDAWHVKIVFQVASDRRFDMVQERLQRAEGAVRFECRAYCLDRTVPILVPLLIGQRHVFVGIQEKSAYRVREALHLIEADGAELMSRYWRMVWDPAPFRLRDSTKSRPIALQALREAVTLRMKRNEDLSK